MPLEIYPREGGAFSDVVWIDRCRAFVTGSMDRALLKFDDGRLIPGTIELISTHDSDRPTRHFVFHSNDGIMHIPFGETYLSLPICF